MNFNYNHADYCDGTTLMRIIVVELFRSTISEWKGFVYIGLYSLERGKDNKITKTRKIQQAKSKCIPVGMMIEIVGCLSFKVGVGVCETI